MFLGIRSKNIERAVQKDKIDIIVAQTAAAMDGWSGINQEQKYQNPMVARWDLLFMVMTDYSWYLWVKWAFGGCKIVGIFFKVRW